MVLKRRGKKRFSRKKRNGKKSVATKSYVKKMIRKESETKYFDLSLVAQPYLVASTATQIIDLCAVAQGTTDITRIGDKLTIRGLDMRFDIQAADTTNIMRCIIFQWYPNTTITGTDPQGSQIISDTTTFPWISNYVHDFQNQANIVYDSMVQMNPDRTVVSFHLKPNMKWVKKTINYSVASTAGSNKLYLLLVSDSAAGPHPFVRVQSRLRFDDS